MGGIAVASGLDGGTAVGGWGPSGVDQEDADWVADVMLGLEELTRDQSMGIGSRM